VLRIIHSKQVPIDGVYVIYWLLVRPLHENDKEL